MRSDFGGTIADYTLIASLNGGLRVASANLTFWTAQTGGTQYTDLVFSGSPASVIHVGSDGQVPVFQGPDGITAMWADAGGPRVLMISATNMAALAAAAATSASDAATSAASATAVPATADKIVYVSNRGSDANTGSTWKSALLTVQAAVTALGGPGVIQLGQGSITTGTTIAIPSGVTVRGMAAPTAGATPATSITYTGTGSGSFITANSTVGVVLENLMILYSSSSFTGRLVDLRDGGSRNTAFALVRDCFLGGSSAIRTADCLVDVSNTHSIRFERCQFRSGANYGIRGKNASTDTCGAVTVSECYFNDNTTAHILNPGDGWSIVGCTWEPLHSGAAGAVVCTANFATNGLAITGGWCGDIVAAAGGIQFDLTGNNIAIVSTLIGGNTGSTGVKFRNISGVAPTGLTVAARFAGTATGIDFAGVTPSNYEFSRSSFDATVGTAVSGGNAYPTSYDINGSLQAIGIRNRSTTDGRVPIRFQGDRTSSYSYDLGMDLDGVANKRFGVRDQTRSGTPWVWFVTSGGSTVTGSGAADLATSSTDGFTYIPTTNGTPTGTPTAITGTVPMMYDRSTNKLYVYNGAWKSVTLT